MEEQHWESSLPSGDCADNEGNEPGRFGTPLLSSLHPNLKNVMASLWQGNSKLLFFHPELQAAAIRPLGIPTSSSTQLEGLMQQTWGGSASNPSSLACLITSMCICARLHVVWGMQVAQWPLGYRCTLHTSPYVTPMSQAVRRQLSASMAKQLLSVRWLMDSVSLPSLLLYAFSSCERRRNFWP